MGSEQGGGVCVGGRREIDALDIGDPVPHRTPSDTERARQLVADDLVERRFWPAALNVLWIADVAYVRTWEWWF